MRKQTLWIIQLAVILVIIKGTGFIRDILVPEVFGINAFSDGYYIGLSLVLTLYALLGKAITLNLLPKLHGTETDYSTIKSFVVPATCIAVLSCGLYFFFPNLLINLLYAGTGLEIKQFVDSAIFALPLVPALYALVAYHQIRDRFLLTNINGLIFNLAIIIITVLNSRTYLPWSLFVAMTLQTVWLLWRFDINEFWNSKLNSSKVIPDMNVLLIGAMLAFEQLNLFIDRRYISTYDNGYVTLLDLGSKFSFLFLGIVLLAVTTVVYPKLVRAHREKDKLVVNKMITNLVKTMLVLSGAFTILILIFGEWGLRLILDITQGELDFIAFTLRMYALLIIPLSIREVLLRFFILEGQIIIPTLASIFCLLINGVISALVKIPEYIIYGTVFSVIINTVIICSYYVFYQKRGERNESV